MPKVTNKSPAPKRTKITCGMCGNTRMLLKTDCCDKWICDDDTKYPGFPSFSSMTCFGKHWKYSLCAYHHASEHEGKWQKCLKCKEEFSEEDYKEYTSDYCNFGKSKSAPKRKYCWVWLPKVDSSQPSPSKITKTKFGVKNVSKTGLKGAKKSGVKGVVKNGVKRVIKADAKKEKNAGVKRVKNAQVEKAAVVKKAAVKKVENAAVKKVKKAAVKKVKKAAVKTVKNAVVGRKEGLKKVKKAGVKKT